MYIGCSYRYIELFPTYRKVRRDSVILYSIYSETAVQNTAVCFYEDIFVT